ncbi:MAG: hypothetical protein R3C14_25435 [Caldilineaceae bacterium]
MKRGFTVGQIARALRCHERSARLYLHEVNQAIDHYSDNFGELVDIQTVVALCSKYRDSIIGRRLAVLLQATG